MGAMRDGTERPRAKKRTRLPLLLYEDGRMQKYIDRTVDEFHFSG